MSKAVGSKDANHNQAKKLAFVKHYLLYGHGGIAAESVGHKQGSAAEKAATRYFQDEFVKGEIAKAKAKIADDYGVSKQSIIDRLLLIIDDPKTSSGDTTRAIAELNKMLGFLSPVKTEAKVDGAMAVMILPDNGGKYGQE